MPLATASRTSPAENMPACAQTFGMAGSTHRLSSIMGPSSSTFSTVPSPGLWRRGIQSSSTSTPMMLVSTPMPSPVWAISPWAKTVHGSTPSAARIIRASANA